MRILGCPLKVSSQLCIYFPRLYLEHFGISTQSDIVIREDYEDSFIYRPYTGNLLVENEKEVVIRICNTYIPTSFVKRNHIIPGKDSRYLVEINSGLKVSVNKQMYKIE